MSKKNPAFVPRIITFNEIKKTSPYSNPRSITKIKPKNVFLQAKLNAGNNKKGGGTNNNVRAGFNNPKETPTLFHSANRQNKQENHKALYCSSASICTAEKSRAVFGLDEIEKKGVTIGVSNGIGTQEHSDLVNAMKKEYFGILDHPKVAFYKGYGEKDQLVSQEGFFNFLQDILGKGPTDLGIMGHSRGADASLIGILAYLVATLEAFEDKNTPFHKSIKNLSFVLIDAASGLIQQDYSGAESIKLKELFSRLRKQLPECNIKVTVVTARFDSLLGLKISKKMVDYIDELKDDLYDIEKVKKGKKIITNSLNGPDIYFSVGLSHTGMMEPGTPENDLLRAAILESLDMLGLGKLQKVHSKVSSMELDKIYSIENNTADKELLYNTSTAGQYGKVLDLLVGTSLKKQLKKKRPPSQPLIGNGGRVIKGANIVFSKRAVKKPKR